MGHFQPALLPQNTSFFFFKDFAMASGVKLSDGVKHAYDDIKKHSKYLYAIFIIKDGEIVVGIDSGKGDLQWERDIPAAALANLEKLASGDFKANLGKIIHDIYQTAHL